MQHGQMWRSRRVQAHPSLSDLKKCRRGLVLSELLSETETARGQIIALTLLHIHTLPGGPLPLLCSRAHAGVVLPHPPRTLPHSDTDTHSLLRDCDGRLLSLSLPLSLSDALLGSWQL